MKNLKILTTALFIALMFNSTVNYAFPAIKATANSNQELYNAIEQLVDFPEELAKHSESAYVWTTFSVDDEGWIKVVNVQGKKRFANYIEKQMELISIENPDLYGKTYRIKIHFDFRAK